MKEGQKLEPKYFPITTDAIPEFGEENWEAT